MRTSVPPRPFCTRPVRARHAAAAALGLVVVTCGDADGSHEPWCSALDHGGVPEHGALVHDVPDHDPLPVCPCAATATGEPTDDALPDGRTASDGGALTSAAASAYVATALQAQADANAREERRLQDARDARAREERRLQDARDARAREERRLQDARDARAREERRLSLTRFRG